MVARAGAQDSSAKRIARLRLLAPALALALCGWAHPGTADAAAAANVISPLPASDYLVQPACGPALPGRASCQALELVPLGSEARAHRHPLGMSHAAPRAEPSPAEGDYGLTPADLHSAYDLPKNAPTAQTIALVDAYNDPAAEEDLAAYDSEFGLPACTAASGCFTQVNEYGEKTNLPFPGTLAELSAARGDGRAEEAEEATEWGIEMSLDIETAHAVCESCHIVLAEASEPSGVDLEDAERSAEALGATEISNSWAGPEQGESEASERRGPFDHPGTVITASAGDSGYLDWDSRSSGSVEFPASSPHVIAVGGTRLSLTRGGAWSRESVWDGDGAGGGGCSTVFKAPSWQLALADWSAVGCAGKRAVADISADADPYTGVAVEDSTSPACEYSYAGHVQHWCTLGGTSLSSPLIAAVFALAGGSGGVAYPASTLYANALTTPASLHDITEGSNGACSKPFDSGTGESGCSSLEEAASCSARAICLAGAGYDGPTGLGTPHGVSAFRASSGGPLTEESGPGEAGTGEGGEEVGSESGSGGGESGSGEQGSGSGAGKASGEGSGEDFSSGSEATESSELELEEEAPSHSRSSRKDHSKGCALSALSLAPASALAARTAGTRLSEIAFSFEAGSCSPLRVSIAFRRTTRGRARWQKLARTQRIEVSRGHNGGTLAFGRELAAGSYRLTLTPRHGAAVSLQFEMR
jgi:hypothetical protein